MGEHSLKKTTIFLLIIYGITIGVFYLGYVMYRTIRVYAYVTSHQRGWKGKVDTYDAELGFAPIPNSRGAQVFPIGSDIPIQYDEYGFRVPVDSMSVSPKPRPLILTLGCSFTYGYATYAEETYPYLIGHYLKGYTMNAGVCSYGLAQMFILAKRLLPVHKPDYVIVQYSPWLAERAQSPFAPTYFAKLPTPYFYEDSAGLRLHPPVFREITEFLPIQSYQDTPRHTVGEFISFLRRVGLPLFIHDDFDVAIYYAQRIIGRIPRPANNREGIETYVYHEIARIAKENGVPMVIVVLGKDQKPVTIPQHIFPENVLVVNAHSALLERLPEKTANAYYRLYAHWRGSPPQMVDEHPNPYAHKIIAEELAKQIKEDKHL